MSNRDELKKQAADHAVTFVESGMVLGLGHGSTAIYAIRRIAERLQNGELSDIWGIPASKAVEGEAKRLGIPLTDFATHPVIDLTIDGADEVDPNLNLIKGGGGALLREKVLAQASRREVIVVDESKLSNVLGTTFALPIEVLTFGWQSQQSTIEALGARVELRRDTNGQLFLSDQGNYILDCHFGAMPDPYAIAGVLDQITVVVEHGLFLDIATDVIVARPSGIEHLKSSTS